MSIYDFDLNIITPQLLPPQLRQPVHLAWLKVIQTPLQWSRDQFFNNYCQGQVINSWSSATTYNAQDTAIGSDRSVYECRNNGITGALTNPVSDSVNWFKVQDNFIGIDERIRYNSQIIMLEYELNRYFQVSTAATNQIYINNTEVSNAFVMGNSGPTSSNMTNSGKFATRFMGNSPTFTSATTSYTIFVPNAVLASLATLLADQLSIVSQFVNKYNLAGMQYTVIGY